MCGVIGLIYEAFRDDLGKIAGELLRTLEYRGYDSTGAAIQGQDEAVTLRKGVGAPSAMIHSLGIVDLPGQILCGQVRWATFGAVDEINAQPHVVDCKAAIYGAHNGNVTNCDELKGWLMSEGHEVTSDNDGEMVVHTVEHYFALELSSLEADQRRGSEQRRLAMRAAILRAAAKLTGSYAAVIVDPVSKRMWAIKQGSSLYFGFGGEKTNRFGIASSDLSSVLKLTRVVIPLSEGECVEFTPEEHTIFCIRDRVVPHHDGARIYEAGQPVERPPVRSRLRAKDTALIPPFKTFMDQEISAQEETCRAVVNLFLGGSEATQSLGPLLRGLSEPEVAELHREVDRLRDQYADAALRQVFHELVDHESWRALLSRVPADDDDELVLTTDELTAEQLVSVEAGLLADLLPMSRDRADRLSVRLIDVIIELEEVEEFTKAVDGFVELFIRSLERGGRAFVVSCGTSYHAAKAAALFFNELAQVQLIPVLPGEFRGECSCSLRDGDLFVAVSQSGETKDLIDVMNDVIATGLDVRRVAVVNNVNSTLAQEKSHLVIPLRCGPEIAVPATKSFMNQLAVFYGLALRLAEARLPTMALDPEVRSSREAALGRRLRKLPRLPKLIRETFDSTDVEVERAAQLLYLCPSIHLLATRINAVAKEGALKIREVVLNHAEGFEGSEFKHGPNTILGFNTIFGPSEVEALLNESGRLLSSLADTAAALDLEPRSIPRLIKAVTDLVFSPRSTTFSLDPEERNLLEAGLLGVDLVGTLRSDYPLIYITGPDDRDVALTVSQINTHKIRGASTVVIAEEHPALRAAATKAPSDNPNYHAVYITLPRTEDTLLAVFSATVVLQRLALKMSERKMQYLDAIGIPEHGVHPDVPKNVSKSITVD